MRTPSSSRAELRLAVSARNCSLVARNCSSARLRAVMSTMMPRRRTEPSGCGAIDTTSCSQTSRPSAAVMR